MAAAARRPDRRRGRRAGPARGLGGHRAGGVPGGGPGGGVRPGPVEARRVLPGVERDLGGHRPQGQQVGPRLPPVRGPRGARRAAAGDGLPGDGTEARGGEPLAPVHRLPAVRIHHAVLLLARGDEEVAGHHPLHGGGRQAPAAEGAGGDGAEGRGGRVPGERRARPGRAFPRRAVGLQRLLVAVPGAGGGGRPRGGGGHRPGARLREPQFGRAERALGRREGLLGVGLPHPRRDARRGRGEGVPAVHPRGGERRGGHDRLRERQAQRGAAFPVRSSAFPRLRPAD